MKRLRKITVYASLLLCSVCVTSFTSLNATTIKEIGTLELETKAPAYFRGFNRTDESLIENFRNPRNFFNTDNRLQEQFKNLQEELRDIDKPGVEKIRLDLERVIQDEKYSYFWYLVFTARSLILISEKTEEELNFFRLAGFSMPYSLISYDLEETDWMKAVAKAQEDRASHREFDFEEHFHKQYRDPLDILDGELLKRSNNSFPYLVPCMKEKDDIFGFFFLAWCYYRGIHPVPVSLKAGLSEIHGIKMSPWGKFCHDLAHHQIDPSDRSIEGFADLFINRYTSELSPRFKDLTAEEKKKFGTRQMIKPVTNFAAEVHGAYSKAMAAILDAALEKMGVKSGKISDEFKAFSVGAFVQSHEHPNNLSNYLGSPQLETLLTEATAMPKKEGQDAAHPSEIASVSSSTVTGSAQAGGEEVLDVTQPNRSQGPNTGSIVTGSAQLSGREELGTTQSNLSEEPNTGAASAPITTDIHVEEQINDTPVAVGSLPQTENASATTLPEATQDKKAPLLPIEDLIPTSYITGETPFTDEEIVDVVKQRPRSEFRPYWYYGEKIDEDMVANATVTRNQFFIQVQFEMFDGLLLHHRIPTKYSDCLNLKHDRQMLVPAKAVLASKYNYTLPQIPVRDQFVGEDAKYEAAVKECREKLDEGRAHVLDNFLLTAKELANATDNEGLSIAASYEKAYKESLEKLSAVIPNDLGDLQTFINKATEKSK
ncbi:MAG: hypothetical protein ACTHJ4_04580 [Candidatus Nucleicultricaceae bacterium]